MFTKKSTKGFTLLEILLVVGIISVLAGIVIIAINPGRQLAQVRNTERRSDIKQIYNAVQQFYIDKKYYPASTTDYVSSLLQICDTSTSTYPSGLSCSGLVDLSQLVPTYITAIPVDPQGPVSGGTGYWLGKTSTGRIVLNSERAELGATIAIGTSTATTTASLIPTNGLVSYWSFNDAGAGTALDLIGDNNGAVNGAIATTSVKGIANKAYYFDGVNDGVIIPTTQFYDSGTVSLWFNAKSFASSPAFLVGNQNVDNSANYLQIISHTTGAIYLTSPAGHGFSSADGSITVNKWYHLVVMSNGTNYQLYLNGVNIPITVSGTNGFWFSDVTSINQYTIGELKRGSQIYSALNGAIDEVRIYNRSLSSDEVMTIYNEEKP